MLNNYFFTSESVSDGHPDKLCDIISDTILDLYLSYDPGAKVAIETMVTTDEVFISGEVRSIKNIELDQIEAAVRRAIQDVGYEQNGFHWRSVNIKLRIKEQSSEIFMGVDKNITGRTGAGDQGIMFGYANDETPSYMPFCIHYCNQLMELLSNERKRGLLAGLQPDAKCQITAQYNDDYPQKVTSVVLSHQHDAHMSSNDLRSLLIPRIQTILPDYVTVDYDNIHINPTGKFIIGGPVADVGLTGRKIIVDTYGGYAPHGGGAFSGKDPTKVDRSAAYFARYLAKNIVAAGVAKRCLIQLSYAIGMPDPQSVYVNFYNSGKIKESDLVTYLYENIDMSVDGIFTYLDLHRPIYKDTAAFGHFGRQAEHGKFPWESLNLRDNFARLL